MSKLFRLKQWLTIDDAAKYLTSIFDEPVNDYDIFRFALDGHIKLSVNIINGAYAKKCKVVSVENARTVKVDIEENGIFASLYKQKKIEIDKFDCILDLPFRDNEFLQKEDKIISIRGVYDLVMLGNERLDIEHEYQQLTSRIEVTLVCLEGAYLQSPENGNIYELQDHFKDDVKSMKDENNYYPAGSLPNDVALVVRASAISEFIEAVSTDKKIDKPLSDKERETLLVIIAALAKEAKVDITKTSKAGELIASMTQQLGSSIGATTIETHLKKIPQALENRAK